MSKENFNCLNRSNQHSQSELENLNCNYRNLELTRFSIFKRNEALLWRPSDGAFIKITHRLEDWR